MRVRYVSWNYTNGLHLVRLADGRGPLRSTEWCRKHGLCA